MKIGFDLNKAFVSRKARILREILEYLDFFYCFCGQSGAVDSNKQ